MIGIFDGDYASLTFGHADPVKGKTYDEIGKADFGLSDIESFRRRIPKAGLMTQEEADLWATTLCKDSDEGVFFGSSNYYGHVARRR